MPAARMPGASLLAPGLNSAAAKLAWISRSECMRNAPLRMANAPMIQYVIGLTRFIQQRREWWHVGIPFDESRHRAHARQRFAVEIPHWTGDRLAVRIDQAQPVGVEARQMDLLHAARGNRVEVAQRIEAVVDRAHT